MTTHRPAATSMPASPPDTPRDAAAEHPGPGRMLRLVPGQLALPYEYEVSPGVPAVPEVPHDLRMSGDAAVDTPELPDPRIWAARLARAISEVSVGERPPAQLTRWVARDVLTRLALRGRFVQRHPAARAQRGVSRLRSVRAVRACAVAPGVVETSAVIVGGDRAHAIAIRLEVVNDRWLATAVELG